MFDFELFLDVGYTNNGEECRNKCGLYGEPHNWCWTVSGFWDYCTPKGNISVVFQNLNFYFVAAGQL